MSLWWELENVENAEALWETSETTDIMRGIEKGEQYLNTCTHTLIWMMAAIGIATITEENAPDVYGRIAFLEKFKGAMRYGPGHVDVFFTPEDIRRHIGLKTNASKQTETEFLKRCKDWLNESRYAYRDAIKRLDNLAASQYNFSVELAAGKES